MAKVEVELRCFISDGKYDQLLNFFKREGKLVRKDNQVTYYFNEEGSIRTQKDGQSAKLWIKVGKLHGVVHEEIEVNFERKNFDKLERAMAILGHVPKIKWFRLRYTFRWKGISVMLDRTRGYGNIIELEIICDKKDKSKALKLLNKRLAELRVRKTTIDRFNSKYAYYVKNWRVLTRSSAKNADANSSSKRFSKMS